MGFKKVYKALQEIFPEVDSRILRAVAIEHCKDPDTAVEVVLSEIIPCLSERNKLPSASSGETGVAVKSSEAAVDANGAPQTDAALLHNTKDSDELQNGLSFYDASCGHHQTLEDIDGESLQYYHDAVGGDRAVLEGSGSGTAVSREKCAKTNVKVNADESCKVISVMSNAEDSPRYDVYEKCGPSLIENEERGQSASLEANPFKVKDDGTELAYNQLYQPTECVVSHSTLEVTDNSPSDDSTALMHKKIVSSVDNLDMKDPESQLASLNAQNSTLSGSESSIELVVAPDARDYELEKELNDAVNVTFNNDLAGEMLVDEVESMPNPVVTASGQICSVDLLEDMITEAKSNKKTLFSAVESVICLMREVELQEEAAEQAKQEAAKGGLDMLQRVEDLKEMLQHAKEANNMHAGEVYGEKAILATEVKELQSRLLGLADERDKSLTVLDEMHQTLEVRKAAAEKVMKAAEQERLDKEGVARKALTDQEIIMEKVVQESNILKQEAEENAKLRDFLVDRGRVVDMLQLFKNVVGCVSDPPNLVHFWRIRHGCGSTFGESEQNRGEISVICQDVRLLKEKFDDRIPLSKSLCSNQTSCILASSSSSLKSMVPDQVADPADLLDAPEKMDTASYHEDHTASEDVKSVIHDKDLLDDEWEICDNRELCM